VPNVNLLIAFAAGALGFLSPCIVPLIPGYLSFVSGLSLADLTPADRRQHRLRVLGSASIFVLGFATIFTALGASATYLGSLVLDNRVWLGRIGGAAIVVLGLWMLGILKIPALARERRLPISPPRGGMLGAFPVGVAFGFAWTPCVGPVLAAILTIAATSRHPSEGAVLLLVYALGLGLPFLITAVLLSSALDALAWVRVHGRAIEVASGAFLVVMGTALMFDLIYRLNTWILRLVPFQPVI
jgi:cytochrome c-type biogenesis protein